MLMNRIEKAAVNNPARRALQRFRRLADRPGRVRLAVGDATDLRMAFDAADAAYDAAFDFAIIHHIPDWGSGLAEIARVRKPGGVFVFDEVTAHALARTSYRVLFEHP